LLFDIMFIIQHYMLYSSAGKKENEAGASDSINTPTSITDSQRRETEPLLH